MTKNPWTPREPAKKRVITVSVTKEQDEDFERMKAWLGETSDGAVIKAALALLWSQMPETGDCQGHATCKAKVHEHGCYADLGNCNYPEEHGSVAESTE